MNVPRYPLHVSNVPDGVMFAEYDHGVGRAYCVGCGLRSSGKPVQAQVLSISTELAGWIVREKIADAATEHASRCQGIAEILR